MHVHRLTVDAFPLKQEVVVDVQNLSGTLNQTRHLRLKRLLQPYVPVVRNLPDFRIVAVLDVHQEVTVHVVQLVVVRHLCPSARLLKPTRLSKLAQNRLHVAGGSHSIHLCTSPSKRVAHPP